MFGPRENVDKLPKHQLEAPLRILWRKLRDRRWLSDDELHFRNEINNQSCIRPKRVRQCVAPRRKVRFVFAEQRPDKALKGLCQRRVGNVALALVELAGSEKTARRYQHRLQLVDDRGLADTGITGHQHQLRRAAIDDAVERGQQRLDFALTAVQFLRNLNAVWLVMFSQREVVNATLTIPVRQTAAKIALHASCGLITLFRSLGKQFHDD